MESAMKKLLIFLLVSTASCANALAEQPDTAGILKKQLKAQVPSKWEVRVRWRDNELLASITPWPYQEAFQLWYEPAKLSGMLASFCPASADEIWNAIGTDKDIVLEPTVGGKAGVEFRVSCRKATARPS
jgi:hypothetical protein